jgi:hypothetical protein
MRRPGARPRGRAIRQPDALRRGLDAYGEHDLLDRLLRGGGRQLPSLQGANRMTDQLAAAFDARTPHVGAAAAESSATIFS